MKAVVYRSYGPADVLGLQEVPRPETGDDEVLVKVGATSVTTADWRLRASAFPGVFWLPGRLMFGVLKPRKTILGSDFAGCVEAVGANVRSLSPGDRVFGVCGHGGHAEYVAVKETAAITETPEDLSDAEAASLPFGGLSALVFLRDIGKLKAGQSVLVVGASGGVGSYAVQIAAHCGADVAGVCSGASADFVRSLGASRVIDYETETIAAPGRKFDLILDTVGATNFGRVRDLLTATGTFVPLNFGLTEALQALASRPAGQKVAVGVSGDSRTDLETLKSLVESGAVRPLVDRSYRLEQIVEAHRYVEGRHRRGAVVVDLGGHRPEAAEN